MILSTDVVLDITDKAGLLITYMSYTDYMLYPNIE